jgi:type I restriction enzyme, S subunit
MRISNSQLPSEWRMVSIEKIANKVTDGEHITPERSESGVLLLSARNVQNGYLSLKDVDYIPEHEYQRIIKRCHPEYGDVLISCSGTIGRVCIVPQNTRFTLVRSAALIKPSDKINASFLSNVLRSNFVQNQILRALNQSAQANLFINHINSLVIPLPPLLEQCRIAEMLGVWDESIDLLERLIGRVRSRKQGLMQQLLTGKKRFKEFEGSEWKTVNLENLPVSLIDGDRSSNYPSQEFVSQLKTQTHQIIFLNSSNFKDDKLDLQNAQFITKEKFDSLSKGKLIDDDLVMTVRGSIGNVIRFNFKDETGFINAQMLIIRNVKYNNILSTNFLYTVLCSDVYKKRILRLSSGSAQPQLPVKDLKSLDILLPSLPEQEKIAAVLSAADEEISTLEKQLAAYKQQKLGLMQQLLTGSIRI